MIQYLLSGGIFMIPIPLFGSLIGSIIASFGAAYVVERKELENNNAKGGKSIFFGQHR